MVDFYRSALKKIDKMDNEQRNTLLFGAVDEISLLENVLDSINVGIIVCDENNKLVMINKYAQILLSIDYSVGVYVW
jgi:ACT domain-containing protein